GHERLDQHAHHGCAEHDEDRAERRPVDLRRDEGIHEALPRSATNWAAGPVSRASTGAGKKPRNSTRRASGTIVPRARPPASVRPARVASAGPVKMRLTASRMYSAERPTPITAKAP